MIRFLIPALALLTIGAGDQEWTLSLQKVPAPEGMRKLGEAGFGGILKPGHWDMTTRPELIELPGMTPETSKQMLEKGRETKTRTLCISPETARLPGSGFIDVDQSCIFDSLRARPGRIEAVVRCSEPDAKGESNAVTVTLGADYTPESISIATDVRITGPVPTHIVATLSARHGGTCTGAEDEKK